MTKLIQSSVWLHFVSLMVWWFLSSGLDIPKHNEPAYPVEAYGHGHIERLLQILENNPMVVTQGRYSDIARE